MLPTHSVSAGPRLSRGRARARAAARRGARALRRRVSDDEALARLPPARARREGSSPRSSRRTRWPGWCARRASLRGQHRAREPERPRRQGPRDPRGRRRAGDAADDAGIGERLRGAARARGQQGVRRLRHRGRSRRSSARSRSRWSWTRRASTCWSWACRSPTRWPTARSSSARASARCARASTPRRTCSRRCGASARAAELPLVLFSYFNPLLRYGLDAPGREAREARASTACSSPTCRRRKRRSGCARARGRASTPCSWPRPPAPTSGCARVAEASRGFVYAVSRTGVTGERDALSDDARAAGGAAQGADRRSRSRSASASPRPEQVRGGGGGGGRRGGGQRARALPGGAPATATWRDRCDG